MPHVNNGQGVYDQDVTVVEAQQKAIDQNPRLPSTTSTSMLAHCGAARMLIDRMLAGEHGPSAQASNVARDVGAAVAEQIDWRSGRLRSMPEISRPISVSSRSSRPESSLPPRPAAISIPWFISTAGQRKCAAIRLSAHARTASTGLL